MRQIAFFTTDWNYELVGETLRGVSRYLEEHSDVDVRVFDCFSIDEGNLNDFDIYEIYQIVDLDRYDGAIVQTHQIVFREVANRLERLLTQKGIPAVTVGTPLGEMPLIRTDDYEAFRRIAAHVIETHGAKRMWFLKGLELFDEDAQSEARQRRFGFRDECREKGIPEESIRILEGNWKSESGREAARLILEAGDRPDALICANDDMALGAVAALREGGLRVPEDVIVTGYDGIFSSALSNPRLATVDRNFSDVGYLAMDTVVRMARGETPARTTCNRTRDLMTGTCGCKGNQDAEIIRIKDRFYRQSQFIRHFYLTQDKIANSIFSAETLQDVMAAIEEHSDIFGGKDMRIYLDKRYFRSLAGLTTPEEEAGMADGRYSGRFLLTADSRERVSRSQEYREYGNGWSQRKAEEGTEAWERLIQYYPLRFGRTMVGVLMLRGLCAAADMNLHASIVNELVLSLEMIRQHQELNRLNARLNDLYVTDQLTGLNNRFGVARFGQPLFDSLSEAGQPVEFIFLDIDDMKGINDRYGHDAGDEALRIAAEALRTAGAPGTYLMRYGGDEFITFGPAQGERYAETLRKELERLSRERKLPFEVQLSLGRYVRPPESRMTLEDCLQEADLRMYEAKKRRKQEREKGPNP